MNQPDALPSATSDLDPPLPGMGAPARRALWAAGITDLRQLTEMPEGEVRLMHGMGPRTLERLHRALHEHGWSFAARPAQQRS